MKKNTLIKDGALLTKEIQFKGTVVGYIFEDGVITAIIKVIIVYNSNDINPGEVRLLKFNTFPEGSYDNDCPLYDISFIDQLWEQYDLDSEFNWDYNFDYIDLLGMQFLFCYEGKLSHEGDLYQYQFKKVSILKGKNSSLRKVDDHQLQSFQNFLFLKEDNPFTAKNATSSSSMLRQTKEEV